MNLGDMLDELVLSVGMDSANVRTVLTRGVNAGIMAATLKFQPPEQWSVEAITIPSSTGSASLTSYNRIAVLYVVNNSNNDKAVFYLAPSVYDVFHHLLEGNVIQCYTLLEDRLSVRPLCSVSQNLSVIMLTWPSRVVDEGDTIPLDRHIEYIMSIAMEYYWASKEETESQAVWSKLGEKLALDDSQIATFQRKVREDAL